MMAAKSKATDTKSTEDRVTRLERIVARIVGGESEADRIANDAEEAERVAEESAGTPAKKAAESEGGEDW
jgi:hypothetical protein